MKNLMVVAAAALIVAGVCAFEFLDTTVRSLERLGIPPDITKDCIFNSFRGGYLSYPNAAKLKQVASGQRGEAVREIVAFARSYSQTDEFKKKYLEYRDDQKPAPPEPPKTIAEQKKEQKEQLTKSIQDAETNRKALPADQQGIFQQTIDMMKQQLKEIDNPDNPMYSKDMENMMKQGYNASMQEYNTKVAEWEQKYPTDPKPMIKKWLTDFLEATQDINFDAKLTPGKYGKMAFADQSYESKPSQWKMCYRAGKETVQAGRTAAQQWLKELK